MFSKFYNPRPARVSLRDELVPSFLSREYQQADRSKLNLTSSSRESTPVERMLSLDRNDILRYLFSSDEGGLLIGHTDVLSRTQEHGGRHVEVILW